MAIDTIGTNALATGAVNTSKIASSAVDDYVKSLPLCISIPVL